MAKSGRKGSKVVNSLREMRNNEYIKCSLIQIIVQNGLLLSQNEYFKPEKCAIFKKRLQIVQNFVRFDEPNHAKTV